MSLTPEQVQIIRSTVPVLQEHGIAITTKFYSTMLSEVPELNDVFNQGNQLNQHQAKSLAGVLYAYASHIDDLGVLVPAVEKMCQKHASLYIHPEQYDIVGTYLLRAMGDVLGSALTPEILEAWGAAYWQLANIMIKREGQLLQENPEWKDWRDFKIVDKVKESKEITSFYLQPLDGQKLPTFLPGRYISVMIDVLKLHHLQPRQYSLSDASNLDYYRISVKRHDGTDPNDAKAVAHPGIVSNILHDEKQVGDVVKVSHPAGEFFYDPEKDNGAPLVLLSAGVGLTPMMSILNTAATRNSKRPISFIHGARTSAARAFFRHIRDSAAGNLNVKYSTFIKTPDAQKDMAGQHYNYSGRIDLKKLDGGADLHLDDKTTQYFICGPDSFMTDMEKALVEHGVEKERINMELFATGMTPHN